MRTKKFTILVDAGFLKRKLGTAEKPVTSKRIVQFTDNLSKREEMAGYRLHRIYYYDAEPMKGTKPRPLTGGERF